MRVRQDISRRAFLGHTLAAGAGVALSNISCRSPQRPEERSASAPNILLLVADDLNWDTPRCCGGTNPQVTPNIDALAASGMRFEHAHVCVGVCQPSRSAMMTGMYPHRCGGEGFHPIRNTSVTTLPEHLRDMGYVCGILGKVEHSTPKPLWRWDMVRDMASLGLGRHPDLYYRHAKPFMAESARAGRPFFLMANAIDPHRPFAGSDQEQQAPAFRGRTIAPPSRWYRPDEVAVPGFLPDLPEIRMEVAEYTSSCRRCDDVVGGVLKALQDSGQAHHTAVVFLSDNGMPFPFAKATCYPHGTRTPLIVRIPGITAAGSTDGNHMVSCIDLMPTLLAIAGGPAPQAVDGRSMLPLLQGKAQDGRQLVFTQFHQIKRGPTAYPTRCVQDKRYVYIFNPWSDGRRLFRNAAQSGRTFAAMAEAAKSDPAIARRVRFLLYRTREEFYDLQQDPDATANVIDDPRHQDNVSRLRHALETWMRQTNDTALEAFQHRTDASYLATYMAEEQARAVKRAAHIDRASPVPSL